MLALSKVAVTGGLSCGKTSVCHFFKRFGAYVVSADDIVHRLLSPTTNLGQRVILLIGSDIVINNQIDRSKISQKVFKQPLLLKSLENLLHPAVQDEIKKHYDLANQQENRKKLFVAEIPLLFEARLENFYDTVISVVADLDKSKKRFQKATGKSIEEYERRSARQLPIDEKAHRADYVIVNDSNLYDLEIETKKLMNILTH
ncbi:dephospho-CoA kinase [Neochlamydia sp. AcF65]|uniref:dephospho-CoA kinase n=1 Tax=Neochlamydia sp. AcF65 TaxID=2795735 RepID=UPI001BC95257|nr:dephospho-CoA kinase [Neochlamydia sp. AcF65]